MKSLKDKLPSHFYKISGKASGPNVVIMGGTHGDEKVGVEIIKKCCDFFGLPDILKKNQNNCFSRSIKGNLFLGIGNPTAVAKDKRGVDGTDLNRCFSRKHLNNKEKYVDPDYKRARELKPLLEQTDFLLDLHSTSNPSTSFICFESSSFLHEKLCKVASVEYLLSDPKNPSVLSRPSEISVLGTTDYYVNNFGGSGYLSKKYEYEGGVGLCYETGQYKDFTKVKSVFTTVLKMIKKIGVISKDYSNLTNSTKSEDTQEQRLYQLTNCVQAKSKEFEYKPTMDKGWKEITKGEVVGRYTDLEKEVDAPESGLLLFPRNSKKIRFKGDALFYIAKKADN